MNRFCLAFWGVPLLAFSAVAEEVEQVGEPLRLGVTNHSYFSWASNLCDGLPVEVQPLVPAGNDPHSFPVRPQDLERLLTLDAVILNGLGHDRFLEKMLVAAGREALPKLALHGGVPLIPYHRTRKGDAEEEDRELQFNPHTFLSLSTAIQQIYNLQRHLQSLMPEHRTQLRANATSYVRRLRELKRWAVDQLQGVGVVQVATVHDGYAYLLQEFGVPVAAVVEPRHGIQPSVKELADGIATIQQQDVQILFGERDYPRKYLRILAEETGAKVYSLSHISHGEYTAAKFEQEMRRNLETIVEALQGS